MCIFPLYQILFSWKERMSKKTCRLLPNVFNENEINIVCFSTGPHRVNTADYWKIFCQLVLFWLKIFFDSGKYSKYKIKVKWFLYLLEGYQSFGDARNKMHETCMVNKIKGLKQNSWNISRARRISLYSIKLLFSSNVERYVFITIKLVFWVYTIHWQL